MRAPRPRRAVRVCGTRGARASGGSGVARWLLAANCASTIAPHAASTALPWYDAARAAAGYGSILPNEGCINTLHGAIAAAAAAQPDAPAVLSLDAAGGPARVALSHAQLQQASTALAAALNTAGGCGKLRCAAVLLDGAPSRLVAYLAVLQAGLAYAPVEAQLPPAALRAALAAAAPRVVVTSLRLLAALSAALPRRAATLVLDDATGAPLQHLPPAEAPSPHSDEAAAADDDDAEAAHRVAHVSFTSGSTTGVPRLLACGHGGSLLSHAWRAALCAPRPGDVTASAAFGIWDAAAALLAGGAVAPLPDATVRNGGALARALLRCNAARLMLTPTLAAALLADAAGAAALRRLKLLTLCGEPPGASLLAALREALPGDGVLLNLYSTAEAHDVAAARVGMYEHAADDVTCGFVAPFAAVHILKPKAAAPPADASPVDDRELSGVGELGEVWLGGAALADGHVSGGRVAPLAPGGGFRMVRVAGLPHATPHGIRLFSTGDLGRLCADGRLQVVGRDAGAAKLKLAGGATADACAIEAALLQRCPAAAAAAVAARDGVLAAFLVARSVNGGAATTLEARDVREALRGAVPDCALPQRVVWLPRLPMGPTGKLDRAALPWPTCGDVSDDAALQPQSHHGDDELVTALMLFAEAAERAGAPPLSRGRGAATHFLLDAGGTSVAAAAMLTAAADAHGGDVALPPLSLPEFLAEPTAGALAAMLRRRRDGAASAATRAAADAAEAELAQRDAEELPVSADAAEHPRRDTQRDVIVLTGAAGAVGAHVLAALTSLLEAPTVVVCLVRAADDAAAMARLRAAAEAHGLPDPSHPRSAAAGVSIEAQCADLAAPHLGLRGGAAAYGELASRARVVLHAAGRVSLAAPYVGQLRADNVIVCAAALRLACAARAAAHVVSSSAALPGAPGDDVAAPPGRALPAGGYGRAKWAAERLAQRAAAASAAGVTLHRVGYTASMGPASPHGTPPDAQATVLAACAALCAAPHAPQWRLAWASTQRFAAALARAAAAAPDAVPDAALRVVHHGASPVPFAAALAALRERGLPTATLPPAAWAAAVRGSARDGIPAALRCAALLDAIGLEAAFGALDVHLQPVPSTWPLNNFHDGFPMGDDASLHGEGAAVLDAVLEALRRQGMVAA